MMNLFVGENLYNTFFQFSYILVLIPTLLVIISAFLSAKSLGGTLGLGLKKVALGTIIYTAIFFTYLVLKGGSRGLLSDRVITLFFLGSGIFGSLLLITGYMQIYKVSKKLKLFTI